MVREMEGLCDGDQPDQTPLAPDGEAAPVDAALAAHGFLGDRRPPVRRAGRGVLLHRHLARREPDAPRWQGGADAGAEGRVPCPERLAGPRRHRVFLAPPPRLLEGPSVTEGPPLCPLSARPEFPDLVNPSPADAGLTFNFLRRFHTAASDRPVL